MNTFEQLDLAWPKVPVVDQTDVVVVGGGPAGLSAAVSAARNGAKVALLERYSYLGGMASGGMVLILDDMHCGAQITTQGLAMEITERMAERKLAVYPPEQDRCPDRSPSVEIWRKWMRWGVFDFRVPPDPYRPIIFAVAFDPDAYKQAAMDMALEAKVDLRLHSSFIRTIVDNKRAQGVVFHSKEGFQAIRAEIVIDATGDLDVAADAGESYTKGMYIVTTVSRLGGVDFVEAERFEFEEPEKFKAVNAKVKKLIGGSWEHWWLKTPLPGVVWCNCPHMPGYDAITATGLTAAEIEGRKRMHEALVFIRAHMPGFAKAYFVDFAPQTGVRQTRLLEGEYVVTKEDVYKRRHFADTVCRGRDYYTPYRSLLPKQTEQLLVAGRHYSATTSAQKASREIPPCMAMGEAAGVAAALALSGDVPVRKVDVKAIQAQMRKQGADPGDVPSANALVEDATA